VPDRLGVPSGIYPDLKVTNKKNGRVLAFEAGLADTVFGRMKGLLCRASLQPGEGLVLTPCVSIHTFGMKFVIDAVFYDGSRKAVAVLHRIKPNRATRFYPSAAGVLELPAGTLEESAVEVGDELEFTT
jgi:uncharacterized membrane protein (UPF0127 family)